MCFNLYHLYPVVSAFVLFVRLLVVFCIKVSYAMHVAAKNVRERSIETTWDLLEFNTDHSWSALSRFYRFFVAHLTV